MLSYRMCRKQCFTPFLSEISGNASCRSACNRHHGSKHQLRLHTPRPPPNTLNMMSCLPPQILFAWRWRSYTTCWPVAYRPTPIWCMFSPCAQAEMLQTVTLTVAIVPLFVLFQNSCAWYSFASSLPLLCSYILLHDLQVVQTATGLWVYLSESACLTSVPCRMRRVLRSHWQTVVRRGGAGARVSSVELIDLLVSDAFEQLLARLSVSLSPRHTLPAPAVSLHHCVQAHVGDKVACTPQVTRLHSRATARCQKLTALCGAGVHGPHS